MKTTGQIKEKIISFNPYSDDIVRIKNKKIAKLFIKTNEIKN